MTEHEPSHQLVELATCYRLGQMPYIPHYRAFGVYCAPGGRWATLANLKEAGATPYKEYLWPRPDEFSTPWSPPDGAVG